jgi:hypothetical protein
MVFRLARCQSYSHTSMLGLCVQVWLGSRADALNDALRRYFQSTIADMLANSAVAYSAGLSQAQGMTSSDILLVRVLGLGLTALCVDRLLRSRLLCAWGIVHYSWTS